MEVDNRLPTLRYIFTFPIHLSCVLERGNSKFRTIRFIFRQKPYNYDIHSKYQKQKKEINDKNMFLNL